MDEEADKNTCRISCYGNYFIKKLLVKYCVPLTSNILLVVSIDISQTLAKLQPIYRIFS